MTTSAIVGVDALLVTGKIRKSELILKGKQSRSCYKLFSVTPKRGRGSKSVKTHDAFMPNVPWLLCCKSCVIRSGSFAAGLKQTPMAQSAAAAESKNQAARSQRAFSSHDKSTSSLLWMWRLSWHTAACNYYSLKVMRCLWGGSGSVHVGKRKIQWNTKQQQGLREAFSGV